MPKRERAKRIPLIRLGLTLLIGSVFVSVLKFYIGLGQSLGSMTGEAPSTQPRDMAKYFVNEFLFAGTMAGVLFWVGVALCVAGAMRNFGSVKRKQQPN